MTPNKWGETIMSWSLTKRNLFTIAQVSLNWLNENSLKASFLRMINTQNRICTPNLSKVTINKSKLRPQYH